MRLTFKAIDMFAKVITGLIAAIIAPILAAIVFGGFGLAIVLVIYAVALIVGIMAAIHEDKANGGAK